MKVPSPNSFARRRFPVPLERCQAIRAFTLVETLTVLGIVILLYSVATPTMHTFIERSSVNRTISDFPLLVELARSEAKARSAYVWVGLKVEKAERYTMSVAMFASGDGTQDASGTNARQISKTLYFNDIRIGEEVATVSEDLPESFDLPSERQSVVTLNTGGLEGQTYRNVIQISPTGELSLPPTSADGDPVDLAAVHWINLNLLPTRGHRDLKESSFQMRMSTLTGQIQIIRP